MRGSPGARRVVREQTCIACAPAIICGWIIELHSQAHTAQNPAVFAEVVRDRVFLYGTIKMNNIDKSV